MLSLSSAMRVASSAGKNDSMASSESVTSSGVPNTVIVLISDKVASPTRSLSRWAIAVPSLWIGRRLRHAARIGPQLALQFFQRRVGESLVLAPQPLQQMGAPFREIDDARRDAAADAG